MGKIIRKETNQRMSRAVIHNGAVYLESMKDLIDKFEVA